MFHELECLPLSLFQGTASGLHLEQRSTWDSGTSRKGREPEPGDTDSQRRTPRNTTSSPPRHRNRPSTGRKRPHVDRSSREPTKQPAILFSSSQEKPASLRRGGMEDESWSLPHRRSGLVALDKAVPDSSSGPTVDGNGEEEGQESPQPPV